MYYIALLDSGNYVLRLCDILERQGYVFEVISTPCQIAKNGCGYCLKFPGQYIDKVLDTAASNNIAVREVFELIPGFNRNRYKKLR